MFMFLNSLFFSFTQLNNILMVFCKAALLSFKMPFYFLHYAAYSVSSILSSQVLQMKHS